MNKLESLRTVSSALKAGHFYSWKKQSSCNCGVVAQAASGTCMEQLALELIGPARKVRACDPIGSCTWTAMLGIGCTVTGQPIYKVFQALFDAGFTRTELNALEYLSDETIRARAHISTAHVVTKRSAIQRYGFLWLKKREVVNEEKAHFYAVKENLIRYLDAWADMIEEAKPVEDELEPQLQEVADRLLAK